MAGGGGGEGPQAGGAARAGLVDGSVRCLQRQQCCWVGKMGSRRGESGDRAEGAGRPRAGQEGLAVLCEAAAPSGQAGNPGALRRGRSSKGSGLPRREPHPVAVPNGCSVLMILCPQLFKAQLLQ